MILSVMVQIFTPVTAVVNSLKTKSNNKRKTRKDTNSSINLF